VNTQQQDDWPQQAESSVDSLPAVLDSPKAQAPENLTQPNQPFFRRIGHGIYSATGWCFGMVSLIFGLAIVSAIPVVNLISLGYLLHISGTIARTGRLRDGFIGVRKAGRIGGVILGIWLVLWPARFLAAMRDSALIVNPTGLAEWNVGLWIVTALTTLHLTWAVLRGGKLRHFVWPAPIDFIRWLRSSDKFSSARDALWNTVSGLQLPFLFWLGARGFAGTLLWLLIPVGLMILASNITSNAGILVSLLGGLILMGVLLYLPFLQVWFARENRFGAFIEVAKVHRLGNKAPFMFWLGLLLTLALAVPLFLMKIELTPAEITWLPALFFVVFGLPARLMVGWAMGRANLRETPRHFTLRWLFRLAALPIVFGYTLILFLTQFISWNGTRSLLEQHAFLVPSPF